MHLLREESKTRPFLSDQIQDTFIMVQKLPEGREKVKRVESQAVKDVCLIARNAIDRIGELERLTSPFDEYEARERLRKTKERLNAPPKPGGEHAAYNNYRWYRDCVEIISRCVAPDMYEHARKMLEKAFEEAQSRVSPEVPPLVQLNRQRPDFYNGGNT